MTDEEKIDFLLRQKTINDFALAGYLMYLSDKGLFEDAEDYVKGFISVLTDEEKERALKMKKAIFEKEVAEYDARRGT
jgi:hypothetical protein